MAFTLRSNSLEVLQIDRLQADNDSGNGRLITILARKLAGARVGSGVGNPVGIFDLVTSLLNCATVALQATGAFVATLDGGEEVGVFGYNAKLLRLPMEQSFSGRTLVMGRTQTDFDSTLPTPDLAEVPIEAMLSVPILASGSQSPVATLNLFDRRARGFSKLDVQIAEEFAVTLSQALADSLSSEDLIGTIQELSKEAAQLKQRVLELENASLDMQLHGVELSETNRKLRTLADTDGLTGLRNQRTLFERLREIVHHRKNAAFVLLDIDNFKTYNDVFGHVEGDEVLRQIGRQLIAGIREGDIAARYGGEEFALILYGATTKVALEIAERLRRAVENHPWNRQQVTICAGVSELLPAFETIEDWVKASDEALYAAKRSGKNRVLAYSPRR